MYRMNMDGVLLITGAAGGIGQEITYAFAEAGVSAIALADIEKERAAVVAEKSQQLATNPQFRTLVTVVDVTDAASVQEMVENVVREFERIDYNVNAAGVGDTIHEPIYNISVENFEKVLDVNTKGILTCNRAVSKVMLSQEPRVVDGRKGRREADRGAIVNIGSANCYAALPGRLSYTTSKHAMMGLTKTAALDCANLGVRVNAVCPSWVRTPMFDEEVKNNPQLADLVKSMSPLGRAAEPEEIAGIVLFLSSVNASYITGTGILVDAGLTLSLHLT